MKTSRIKSTIIYAFIFTIFSGCSSATKENEASNEFKVEKSKEIPSNNLEELKSADSYTKMSVTNQTSDSVDVYVVFAAANTANLCCPEPATPSDFSFLDSIPHNKLMATFKLAPKATQLFDPKGKCFSGNFGFHIEPTCAVKGADFKHGKTGTSIGEFTLNPGACDEAFDISLVNGINCYLKIDVDSGLGWAYGPDTTKITSIANKAMNANSGNPGVYPVNCTDCIRLVNQKPCKNLPLGKPQIKRICNIQRVQRGGIVRLSLVDPPK